MPGREGKTKDFLAQLPAESRTCRDVVHLASEAHVHGHSWADHILTEDSSWKEVGGQKRKGNPEVGIPGASPLAHPGNSSHVESFHLPTPPQMECLPMVNSSGRVSGSSPTCLTQPRADLI